MHITLHEDWDLALPTVRADPSRFFTPEGIARSFQLSRQPCMSITASWPLMRTAAIALRMSPILP